MNILFKTANIFVATKSFGDLVLFEDISFGIMQGDRIDLIVQNATGNQRF